MIHKESLALFGVFRRRKTGLFGVFRPLKKTLGLFGVFRSLILIVFGVFRGRKTDLFRGFRPLKAWQPFWSFQANLVCSLFLLSHPNCVYKNVHVAEVKLHNMETNLVQGRLIVSISSQVLKMEMPRQNAWTVIKIMTLIETWEKLFKNRL